MIGSGKAHVHTVVSIAQAQSKDAPTTQAIAAFASLGTFGSNPSNEERDLHRWLRRIYDIELEVYPVKMVLQVTRFAKRQNQ